MPLDSQKTAQETTKVSMSLFDFHISILHTINIRSNASSLKIRLVICHSCNWCN
jgi:hypothetical protein